MKYFNLTHPQKRVWYLEKLHSGSTINTISGLMKINGVINVECLTEAIKIVIKNNDSLRIRVTELQGDPQQYICPYKDESIPFFDFTAIKNKEQQFNAWCKEKIETVIEFHDSKLYEFYVYKLHHDEYGILLKIHHIISDGWTSGVIEKQISQTYKGLLRDDVSLFPKVYSYVDYIIKEKKYLSSKRFLKDKEYWNEKYTNLPGSMYETLDYDLKGNRVKYKISKDRTYKLKRLAERNKVSLTTIFIAVKALYISKVEGIEDMIIGVPVLNRSGVAEKNTIGMFTSTMPLRLTLEPSMTLREIIELVKYELKKGLYHQKYPYDILVNDLNLRKRGHQNLFRTAVNYYMTEYSTDIENCSISIDELYSGEQWYPLQMIVEESKMNGEMSISFDYKLSDYSRDKVDLMKNYLLNIIDVLTNNDLTRMKDLNVMSPNEINYKINVFNNTQEEFPKKTVVQLFEEQARSKPDHIAIMDGQNVITYEQLKLNVNNTANYLNKIGVKKGDRVAILSSHSNKIVEWMLAILKVGASFIPIDPSFPIARINFMLNDSSTRFLYTNISTEGLEFSGVILKEGNFHISNENISFSNQSTQDDIAYILYTSGSTGEPKGVMIENSGLSNYSIWASKQYLLDDKGIFAFFTSISFDLTITSIFAPLVSGKTIDVYQEDKEEFVLFKILKQNRATVVKLTPSHLALLKGTSIDNSSIKRFIVGGENLPVTLASSIYEKFNRNIEIFNEYGPTESSVGCMIHKYNHTAYYGDFVPIGKPAANVSIYLVDNDNKLVPTGRSGEILIAGSGIAKGYLNKPELTENTFVTMENDIFKKQRMYKTGDLARWLPSGEIEYIGRIDAQVKIRGHRIDLSEVEAALLTIEKIHHVVVKDVDYNEQKILCAYIQGCKIYDDRELKRELRKRIPLYMIPTHFIYLEKIPLTQNGKVNYELLPKLNVESRDTLPITYQNDVEKVLFAVLQEVFGHSNLSLADNFFQIGGDSIKGIIIVSKLKDLGYSLNVDDLMQSETVGEIMTSITQLSAPIKVSQEIIDGEIEQTPIIKWFFAQELHNPNYFNQSVLLELTDNEIQNESIERALNKLVTHHDTLRINYNAQTNTLYYNNDLLDLGFEISYFDLTNYKGNDFEKKILEIGTNAKNSFNLENGWLFKTMILQINKESRLILLTAHHLVIDGISWRILLDDFSKLLKYSLKHNIGGLPAKTHSFKEWASVLLEYSQGTFVDEIDYWKNVIVGTSTYQNRIEYHFSRQYSNDDSLSSTYSTFQHDIDPFLTQEFIKAIKEIYRMDVNEGLITALSLTMNKITKMDTFIFEVERHGREVISEDIDISRTLGWFTSMYPIRLRIKGQNLESKIKLLKEAQRKIPVKGFHFGILKYLKGEFQDYKEKLIRVNYLGDFDNLVDSSLFKVVHYNTGAETDEKNQSTYLIEINVIMIEKSLKFIINYDHSKLSTEHLVKLTKELQNQIQEIQNHSSIFKNTMFTPSDFDGVDLSQDEINSIFT
ncbi:amino acid adenylation domain-containing protein [Virgibacillus pantothenticus]|uniref:non-ribosomal peptide synthetase n=1 Tax=Virgibacillus pantothenticus TaxID=1473 RepID=UPI001C2338C0|nr:non-ribosomal peptide synthetase [Virgibacillus pantothenticus]MBU8567930.1 amino acid adenylation domain-containing protein [Virgibacillus pantothenticus]MBU8601810.1 amino acid adenylation domain-containing protein [Virgibacillus pantothenticus]MBU8635964.1 amino acid adenylation domain-containing protein [Virgibacillus pantothenticus]MBU8643648.1 amino acid adenylation domain-containing protein [Virgibacillus pantothenticus]MBU8647788.1 amino acid adenylation domain-containing protein [V